MSTATRPTDLTVANEIRRQLGIQTLALLGASQLVGGQDFLQFKIKGCPRINKIRIVLTPADLYRVEFWHIGRKVENMRMVSERDGIYCDQLHDVIETETGLYTTFHAR